MTREELIDIIACLNVALDGRPFDGLGAADKKRYHDRCAGQLTALSAAESALATERERTAKLEAALEPFARADRAIGDEPGPFRFETLRGYREITREDLRAARAALSPADGGNGNVG